MWFLFLFIFIFDRYTTWLIYNLFFFFRFYNTVYSYGHINFVQSLKQRWQRKAIKGWKCHQMFLMVSLPYIGQLILQAFWLNVNACVRNPRQLTYWNNWSLLTVSSRIWRKTKKTSTGLRMSSSSKRSSSSLSFLAAAVRRPSNFGFQWSMVEQGVLERRLRLLLDGSLAWRLAFWCLLSASGRDVDIVLVSGLWMLVWSGAIAEKILKFRCLSTSFSTADMLGNFSISIHKLMVAVHSSLTRRKELGTWKINSVLLRW